MWLSLVEHSVRDAGVGGSNPLIPTIEYQWFSEFLRKPKMTKSGNLVASQNPAQPGIEGTGYGHLFCTCAKN